MRNTLLFAFITGFLFSISMACEEDETNEPPFVELKSGDKYTENEATVAVGKKITIGIEAYSGTEYMTNLVIKKVLPNGNAETMLDSGIYEKELVIDKVFYQSIEDTAYWKVSVMDRNRMTDSAQMTIYKDPNSKFGGIYHYKSIKMGFQDNEEFGHFLNPFTGKVFSTADSATLFQQNIHIAVYYYVSKDIPSPTFSSPGEVYKDILLHYPYIEEWETKYQTFWDISVDDNPVSVEKFDAMHNDSLLIVEYDDVWGKGKFKWATPGRILPFQTETGKRGMIKVIEAENSEDGTIEFDLKIQR